jgi:hypothetical protein
LISSGRLKRTWSISSIISSSLTITWVDSGTWRAFWTR